MLSGSFRKTAAAFSIPWSKATHPNALTHRVHTARSERGRLCLLLGALYSGRCESRPSGKNPCSQQEIQAVLDQDVQQHVNALAPCVQAEARTSLRQIISQALST